MATKLMTNDNKPATFETGDRAVLMPQLGALPLLGSDELTGRGRLDNGTHNPRDAVPWSRGRATLCSRFMRVPADFESRGRPVGVV